MSGMENEMTSDELLTQRNKLMNEVVSLRRKVPKTLISLDEKIQKTELKELLLKNYDPDAVRDQLASYVQRTSGEGRRVPNFISELETIRSAVSEVEKEDAIFKAKVKNSIDFETLMKKSQEAQKHLLHLNIARKQMSNENPLITRARMEGCHLIAECSKKKEHEEKGNLEMEIDNSTGKFSEKVKIEEIDHMQE